MVLSSLTIPFTRPYQVIPRSAPGAHGGSSCRLEGLLIFLKKTHIISHKLLFGETAFRHFFKVSLPQSPLELEFYWLFQMLPLLPLNMLRVAKVKTITASAHFVD
jgi:hypothetical protein